ncbi:leucyl aminopeptidase, partial [Yersinia pestis]
MKLTINTSFPENGSSQSLLILVDSEQLQNTTATYQINNLDTLIEASQFKAALAESLSLIGQVSQSSHAALIGLGKVAELQPAKLAKIAQTIIQVTQKKFKQISVDLTQL